MSTARLSHLPPEQGQDSRMSDNPPPVTTILEAAMNVSVKCAEAFITQATAYTCEEADAIHDLLNATGAEDQAAQFLAAHAEGDDEGDEHYIPHTVNGGTPHH